MITVSELERRISMLESIRNMQAANGNWDYDAYMHGLYNGLEMASAIMEDREPEFRFAPVEWLADGERGDAK